MGANIITMGELGQRTARELLGCCLTVVLLPRVVGSSVKADKGGLKNQTWIKQGRSRQVTITHKYR